MNPRAGRLERWKALESTGRHWKKTKGTERQWKALESTGRLEAGGLGGWGARRLEEAGWLKAGGSWMAEGWKVGCPGPNFQQMFCTTSVGASLWPPS